MPILLNSSVSSLELLFRGKVRDIYSIDDIRLLMVQTDRISAFDVVFSAGMRGKGKVLTAISKFWFEGLASIAAHHLLDLSPEDVVTSDEKDQVAGRSFVVKRLRPLPVEAVVRGYIFGSGWEEYCRTGAVCGVRLPEGLQRAQKLSSPIFTPATKAPIGEHDENISFAVVQKMIGLDAASEIERISLELYREAARIALSKGIIVADTKFEFGLDEKGKLHLIDEALTPDSSRMWPLESYEVGANPRSLDKQYIRDWAGTQDWNKLPPAPAIPEYILAEAGARYDAALQRIVGS